MIGNILKTKNLLKNSAINAENKKKTIKRIPKLEDCIENRDYLGAVTILEFQRTLRKDNELTLPWLGYAYFHLRKFQESLEVYEQLLAQNDPDPMYHLYAAVNLFYLGRYAEAQEKAFQGPSIRLQNRLLFHISHRTKDETELIKYHEKLSTTMIEDKLSLATVHYLRGHYQDATDIYKELLIQNRTKHIAMHIYIGMCYYQLDCHDVSMEIIKPYLTAEPDSIHAVNLLACNKFKVYDGKQAEAELKSIIDHCEKNNLNNLPPIIKHNLVVFRDGENALAELPRLVDVVPEARLNLAIYHLNKNEYKEALNLVQDLEPTTPVEYILKGIVSLCVGQETQNKEHLKLANHYFQLVGASASECDTIPGRQSMASTFFILQQFDDVLIYLESIKQYLYNDDIFNCNYGVALCQQGRYNQSEEAFLTIQNEEIKEHYCYIGHLSRCYIMNQRAWQAWELYLKMETCSDSMNLLVAIANDCYRVGAFYYAAKAFDVLERLDPAPEYWEGKCGSCCGVLQMVIAGKETEESLLDCMSMLQLSENLQSNRILNVIKCWAEENGMRNY